jgi:uncharacterized protein YmfQ (DUF2313 family)
VDITIYLPDELGQWAKAEGLNLSRMLRDAITNEQHRRDAVNKTLDNVKVHELPLEDGRVGRLTGKLIADDGRWTVYLTEDERVLVYDQRAERVDEVQNPQEELRGLDGEAYAAVADAFGFRAIVDL